MIRSVRIQRPHCYLAMERQSFVQECVSVQVEVVVKDENKASSACLQRERQLILGEILPVN